MNLSELKIGEIGYIKNVNSCQGTDISRLIKLGFIKGEKIELLHKSIFNDPIIVKIMNCELSLNLNIAKNIEVEYEKNKISQSLDYKNINTETNNNFQTLKKQIQFYDKINNFSCNFDCKNCKKFINKEPSKITIALVGNPNCGKTTIYNTVTNKNEYTGNYSGATVDVKQSSFIFNNTEILLFDLPGTYSLCKYSAEEVVTVDILKSTKFDIIINVIDSTKLKRSLLLTMELKRFFNNIICALNFFDKFKELGFNIDINKFEDNFEVFAEPVISKTGFGITNLFDKCVNIINFIRINTEQ